MFVWKRRTVLAPNSYVFIFSVVIFFSMYIFFWTRGRSLDWVWRFSKFSPNSYVFFYCFFFGKEEWVTLEILQTLSKLTPNSLQTQRISFFLFYFLFFGKEEWVWSEFGESPNSLQTRSKIMFFFGYLCHIMSQPKKLLVQEALQSSASSACSTVYELLETSPPRVTPEKQEFGLWVGKGLIDHRPLVTHEW